MLPESYFMLSDANKILIRAKQQWGVDSENIFDLFRSPLLPLF